MTLRTRFFLSSVAACGVLAAASGARPAQAQTTITLISATMRNGGFEAPNVAGAGPNGADFQYNPTEPNPANPTVFWNFGPFTGISLDSASAFSVRDAPAQGSQYGFLQVFNGGTTTISQTFNLSSASTVDLDFAYAGRETVGGNTSLTASIGSASSTYTTTTNSAFTQANRLTTVLGPGTYTLTFTATGTAGDNAALIDNVNLTATETPEPGSLPLVGMGLVSGLGTFGIARKRRKSAAK